MIRWLRAPEVFEPPAEETLKALNLARIARYYRIAPWELAKQPAYWLNLGMLDMEIETALTEDRKVQRWKVKADKPTKTDD